MICIKTIRCVLPNVNLNMAIYYTFAAKDMAKYVQICQRRFSTGCSKAPFKYPS